MTALPAWVDRDAWEGFVEMRQRQEKQSRGKIAWTNRAEKLILAELYKLHAAGHDVNRALDLSTINGWRDVFEPKTKEITNLKPKRSTYLQEQAEHMAAVAAERAVRLAKRQTA